MTSKTPYKDALLKFAKKAFGNPFMAAIPLVCYAVPFATGAGIFGSIVLGTLGLGVVGGVIAGAISYKVLQKEEARREEERAFEQELDKLQPATRDQYNRAKRAVDQIKSMAAEGTAINDPALALEAEAFVKNDFFEMVRASNAAVEMISSLSSAYSQARQELEAFTVKGSKVLTMQSGRWKETTESERHRYDAALSRLESFKRLEDVRISQRNELEASVISLEKIVIELTELQVMTLTKSSASAPANRLREISDDITRLRRGFENVERVSVATQKGGF